MGRQSPFALFCVLCAFALGAPALARAPAPGKLPEVAAAELPQEARETLALIKTSGPFPYRRDGAVFRNFEKRLPARSRGYYREYTVPTPGATDRGARRIVAGAGPAGDVRTSGEYYYTDDHYATFRRIRE
jgi:ribonuclease T1